MHRVLNFHFRQTHSAWDLWILKQGTSPRMKRHYEKIMENFQIISLSCIAYLIL